MDKGRESKYHLQPLEISPNWEIHHREFYNLDPLDQVPEDDKFLLIYDQEDMLWLQTRNYHLDLGWYGSDRLDEEKTGFMLVLYRGQDWNNCELLELKRSQSKNEIVKLINSTSNLVTEGFYEDKFGYLINENDMEYRFIGQHIQYSAGQKIDKKI